MAEHAILGEIAKAVIKPAIKATFQQCGYLVNYNTNISNLKQKAEDLKSKRLDAMKVFESNESNNKERTKAGTVWLTKTEDAEKAADGITSDSENLKAGCWCPNPIKRYRLSKKAFKQSASIGKLETDGRAYFSTSIPAPPPAKLPGAMANNLSDEYKSRANIMEKIMEALKDDKNSIIAVCGSGGVGKTTLMHELREKAKVNGLFNEVAMVVVYATSDLPGIQRKLAEMLGLTSFKDLEGEIAKTDAIHKRLTGTERKTLLILDDIWGVIDLAKLGVPAGSDQPQCKVLLTSRNSNICTQMNSQKIILLEIMPPDEAWNLFKDKAGKCVESDDLKKIAEKVAQECGGLPIALVTVAGALRENKTKEIWKDALKQLREHCVTTIDGMDKNVYSSIKLSYDFLAREVPEAKLLLFLCCQHPEDDEIEVEKLVRYCLALRLFKNVDTLCDTRNRVTSLMEQLKGRFLLEAVDVDDDKKRLGLDRVKMHDIVRYVGCSIVLSSNVERDGVYTEMYNGKKKINGGYEVGASEADYKNLKILVHSEFNDGPMERSFLSQMDELRVLECCLKDEDEDVGVEYLTKLRMLSIETDLVEGEIWSKIGRLTELEILDYNYYNWVDSMLPHQIKQLTHLKLLDLRFRRMGKELVPIARGILPELKNLEMLYLGHFFFKIGPEETEASITELSMLPNLMSLQVKLVSPLQLLRLPLEKLERFSFAVSRTKVSVFKGRKRLIWRTLDVADFRMDLIFESMDLILEKKSRFIFRMTEQLVLEDIDWIDGSWVCLFTKLEYLSLSDMSQLTTLCQNGNLLVGTFGNLRRLNLQGLPKLRHFLVGPTDSLCLVHLQDLTLYRCYMLEGVVSKGDVKTTGKVGEIEEGATDFILHFPNLRVVKILDAYRFRGLYNIYDQDSLVQPLVHPLVMLPSLETLEVDHLHQLKQIAGGRNKDFSKSLTSDWLQNLQKLCIQSCNSLDSVFDFEVMQLMAENELVVTLGKLQNIQLKELPNLTCIFRCRMQNISIPQLQRIEVFKCNKLKNLVASNLIKLLQSLRQVQIRYCEAIEAVFDFDLYEVRIEDALFLLGELEVIDLFNLPNLKHVCRLPPKGIHVFQNLTQLSVDHCASLNYLLSSSIAQSLVSLEHLIIKVCKSMNECIRVDEEHSGQKIVFRSLKSITLETMRNLSSFCSSDQQEFEFPSLEKVVIFGCPQMKIFCYGHLTAHKLNEVEFRHVKNLWETDYNVKSVWENDLNETISHIYKRTLEDRDDLLYDFMSCKEVKLPTKDILEVKYEDKLRHIVGAGSIDIHKIVASKWLRSLRQVNISSCDSLESVFNFKGMQFMADNAHVVTLGELQKISLEKLPNLACIFSCRMQDISIPKLQDIEIERCDKLVNLFASTIITLLHSLKRVTVKCCEAMEAVFDFEGLEVMSKDSYVLLGQLQLIQVENSPKLQHIWRLPPKEVSVFQNLTKLVVRYCYSLNYLISSSMAQSLVNLESLFIFGCKSMKECILMDEDCSGKKIVFRSLKSIILKRLEKLSSFCASDLQLSSFHGQASLVQPLLHPLVMLPSLEELYVSDLGQLKQIVAGRNPDFSKSVTSDWLQNLQKLCVDSCKSLESLFDFEVIQLMGENELVVTLGKLQIIKLEALSNLTCIFRCRMQSISIPQLKTIEVLGCNKLRNLAASNLIKLLQSLRQVKIERCEAMEAVFDFEGLEVMSNDSNVILGELQHIQVENLPKLQHVCRLPPKEVSVFQNLTKLDVTSCDSLSYLLSSSVSQLLVNLESLCIMMCKSMKECTRMEKDGSGKQIVFRSLKSIELNRLEKLSSFCASDLQVFEFPSLERLLIIKCPELKTFCFGLMTADKLHGVEFHYGDPVWTTNLNETVRHFNISEKKKVVVSDTNADNLSDIWRDNEGTSSPNASLASSSSPALIDHVLSRSTELHVSSRNDYPKEDDLVAAVAAVDNVTRDSDGDENTQDTPASVEKNASRPSEIFINEALPLTDTSMQTKAEKALFDSMSNSPEDYPKWSEILIQGDHDEILKELPSSHPHPFKILEHETAVPASPHTITWSSIKSKQPLPQKYHNLQTSKSIPTLLPTNIQAPTSTASSFEISHLFATVEAVSQKQVASQPLVSKVTKKHMLKAAAHKRMLRRSQRSDALEGKISDPLPSALDLQGKAQNFIFTGKDARRKPNAADVEESSSEGIHADAQSSSPAIEVVKTRAASPPWRLQKIKDSEGLSNREDAGKNKKYSSQPAQGTLVINPPALSVNLPPLPDNLFSKLKTVDQVNNLSSMIGSIGSGLKNLDLSDRSPMAKYAGQRLIERSVFTEYKAALGQLDPSALIDPLGLIHAEGTSFPNASLASSSSPALIDDVFSRPTELYVSSRNNYPKEDDMVAATVDNVTGDGDGHENTQATPASIETNASPPSEIFLNEVLPLSDTSMQNKAEKASFDSTSNSPDDDQKRSETLIQGIHDEHKLRTNIEEILKEEQTPSSPPLETLELETAVPASPHALTWSSNKAKQPLPPQQNPPSSLQSTQHPIPLTQKSPNLQISKSVPTLLPSNIQASTSGLTHRTTSSFEAVSNQQIASELQISLLTTSQEENKADLQELKKKVDEITAHIGSHGSKLESIDAHLAALLSQLINSQQAMSHQQIASQLQISQLITSQRALQSQLAPLLHTQATMDGTPKTPPSSSATSALQIKKLKEKLHALKKKNNVPISDYLLHAINIADSLTSAGVPVDDEELIQCILGGLGHEDRGFLTFTSTARDGQFSSQQDNSGHGYSVLPTPRPADPLLETVITCQLCFQDGHGARVCQDRGNMAHLANSN